MPVSCTKSGCRHIPKSRLGNGWRRLEQQPLGRDHRLMLQLITSPKPPKGSADTILARHSAGFFFGESMKFTPWISALLITLSVGAIAAKGSTQADRETAAALSSREFAGQEICGQHATPAWTDDQSLECWKELP